MSFSRWADSKIRQYHWYHISLIKLSVAGFVLMVAKLWPPLLGLEWHWYALIAFLAAIPPLGKFCGCGASACNICRSNPCKCEEKDVPAKNKK